VRKEGEGSIPLMASQRVPVSTLAGICASFHVCVASFDTKMCPCVKREQKGDMPREKGDPLHVSKPQS
jgi:hypothetical protein